MKTLYKKFLLAVALFGFIGMSYAGPIFGEDEASEEMIDDTVYEDDYAAADMDEDEGPDPPPGAPIDGWLPLLMLGGLCLAHYRLAAVKKRRSLAPDAGSEHTESSQNQIPTISNSQKLPGFNLPTTVSLLATLLLSGSLYAQVQNNGGIFVSDNSSFHVGSGSYMFGPAPAATKTTKTDASHGVLSFAPAALWSGASSDHYTEGYVRHYGSGNFLYPIGDAGIYAPLAATSGATRIDAAYFRSPASAVGSALDATVLGVSAVEFWKVIGLPASSAKITLTWRADSNIASLTGSDLNKLTIAGWNGTKWVEIISVTDANSILGGTSTLLSGSITTISDINLDTYSTFTLANRSNVDCEPGSILASNVFWTANGWSTNLQGTLPTAAPDATKSVVLITNYSGPSFTCHNLTMNGSSSLTINDGVTIEVRATLLQTSGTGRIIVRDGGSFIRRSTTTLAANLIMEVEKTTRDMRRNDYIYWGSPVQGDAIPAINAATAAATGSLPGAFDLKYNYASGPGGGWVAVTSTSPGKGFITRVRNQSPFTQLNEYGGAINVKFTGKENTGNITVPIVNNPGAPNGGTSYNLIANPYPSPIDLDKFLIENLDIDGSAYLWTSATPTGNNNNNATSYTAADYAVYNLAGQVNTSPVSLQVNGRIAVGQGFKVKSLVNSGNVTFNNCMRVSGNGVNFFRQNHNEQNPTDRFKLNLTAEGIYSEILIAYLPEATLGYDRLYDAARNSTSPSKLYSIMEEAGTKLAINSRPEFSLTDVVALGVSKTGTAAQTFAINLSDKSGVFANSVKVYLHDKELGLYHDLTVGSYTFTTSSAVSDTRFEVVYEDVALGNPDFESSKVMAFSTGGQFTARASAGIEVISIYDIAGRKVVSYDANGEMSGAWLFPYAKGIYVAKILVNGEVLTRKFVSGE